MPDLSEVEYDALDELWTITTPGVSGDGKNGFFMKHKGNIIIVSDISAEYLRTCADEIPPEIIEEL